MDMIYLDNIIFSLQKSGGISVVWYNIVKKIITENNIAFECLEYPNAISNIFREGIDLPTNKISIRKQFMLPVSRYLPVLLKNRKKKFVFHSSYYRYCLNKNAKNITTVHDFTYEYFSSGLKKKIHCLQKYRAIRHSDIIVCISENTKRDLLKFLPDIDRNKIRVVFNGVSDDYYPMEARIKELADYVLFVGARGGYKNFRFVVEALKNTPFKLAVCGKPLSLEEQQLIDSTLGQSRCKVFENVDNRELNLIYNSVYCLAYPSSYEGFGIPVLEAQRAGCPVIALNKSSIPEIIGETPLLMKELDKDSFIEKLHILKDIHTRDKIVKSGLENSRRFSWNKMADEYLVIYRDLLEK